MSRAPYGFRIELFREQEADPYHTIAPWPRYDDPRSAFTAALRSLALWATREEQATEANVWVDGNRWTMTLPAPPHECRVDICGSMSAGGCMYMRGNPDVLAGRSSLRAPTETLRHASDCPCGEVEPDLEKAHKWVRGP